MDHKKKLTSCQWIQISIVLMEKARKLMVKALRKGKTVKVYIEPLYDGVDIRPYKCEIEYSY